MKKKTEFPPDLAPQETITAEELIELPPAPPMDVPPEIPSPAPRPEEPFLRRG